MKKNMYFRATFRTTHEQKMTPQDLKQLRAFARQDGAILGAAWIASFVCAMLSLQSAGLALLSNLLALATPFLVAFRLGKFRDQVLGGYVSFGRALLYCVHVFGCATLLLTVAQFLYLRYLDASYLTYVVETYRQILETTQGMDPKEVAQMIDTLDGITPVAWVSAFMIGELLVGAVLSPLIAWVGHWRSKTRLR